MALFAPTVLAEHHELDHFHSGEASLDDWLKERALKLGWRGEPGFRDL